MDVASLLRCRRMVDRGPNKRVAECDPCVHVQEAFVLDRISCRPGDTDLRGGAPHEPGITGRFGRRDEEKATGLRRQIGESSAEARLDAASGRKGEWGAESSV